MNHSYCLLWNDATQRYIAAPETARRRGKSRTALALAPIALLLGALLAPHAGAQALPSGGKVISGQAGISQNGRQMTIDQTSPKAILHWQGFDIGAGAKVQFNQPSANSVALNRVLGGKASRIDGQLKANGQVWLVNPNGMVFGQGSQVNVGGLVASTLDITNDDFHAAKQIFSRGVAQGGITNQGHITVADGGTLALLAPHVNNEGTLSARLGNVVLAGGDRVTLQAGADGRLQVAVDPATVRTLIENRQLIKADGGQVVMTSSAADALSASVVANTGTVQARTLSKKEGRILLLADMQQGEVVHSGLLDASAPAGGHGGFVETSAAQVTLPVGHQVTTQAVHGATGAWLIDPNDYTIAAIGGDISGAQLSANLATSDIIIETANGAVGGQGDIHVNDAVTWSANKLTLNAERNLNVNTEMKVNGRGTLHLNYGNTQGNAARAPVAYSNLNAKAPVDFEQAGVNLLAINGHGYEVINTVDGLQGIGAEGRLGGRYALGRSIDTGSKDNFVPIGTLEKPFTGSFDGLGHTISHLTIRRPDQNGVGLFGQATGAALRNVKLEEVHVTGNSFVGGLAGRNQSDGGLASISNVHVSQAEVSGTRIVGGLVGQNVANDGEARISNASFNGSASGESFIGGLVGANSGLGGTASILDAHAHAPVQGRHDLGGLVGINTAFRSGAVALDQVNATGNVFGGPFVGGLVGNNQIHFGSAVIRNAGATGDVSSEAESAGTLIGLNQTVPGLGRTMISDAVATGTVISPIPGSRVIGANLGWPTQIHSSVPIAAAGTRAKPRCARTLF